MNSKLIRRTHFVLIALVAVIVICFIIQTMHVYNFNNTVHTNSGNASDEETYIDVHPRGDATSSWYKENSGLYGIIYDATIHNNSKYNISSWTLRLNIKGDCYLNQFWNGEVEIYQTDFSGSQDADTKKTQTIRIVDYLNKLEEVTLNYVIDASDVLFPLYPGDYIIYHPYAPNDELKVASGKTMEVGFIVYYIDSIDMSDYTFDFYYEMAITDGPMFIVLCALIALLAVLLLIYISARVIYRRAEKEMELRKSGISCMSVIYDIIYIVDLVKNTITPVGVSEENDARRPKDMTADEQLKNLFNTEAEDESRDLMLEFADLSTLPGRLENRNTIVAEYKSKQYGWVRLRFIVMDKEEGKPVEKVLLTMRRIGEEKMEIDRIREQMEKESTEKLAKSNFLENVFSETQTPVRTILAYNTMITQSTDDEQIKSYTDGIRNMGESFLDTVSSALDYSQLVAGKLKIENEEYDIYNVLNDVIQLANINIKDKKIELITEIAPNMPKKLLGDADKIRQILGSLVTKEIDLLAEGSIKLRVFGKSADGKKLHLLVSAQQTGTIAEEASQGLRIRLVEGLLELMNSKLNTASIGTGRDYYFELDQEIAEQTGSANTEA